MDSLMVGTRRFRPGRSPGRAPSLRFLKWGEGGEKRRTNQLPNQTVCPPTRDPMTWTLRTGPQGQHGKVQAGTDKELTESFSKEQRSEKQNYSKPSLSHSQTTLTLILFIQRQNPWSQCRDGTLERWGQLKLPQRWWSALCGGPVFSPTFYRFWRNVLWMKFSFLYDLELSILSTRRNLRNSKNG